MVDTPDFTHPPIRLTLEERATLERWARGRRTARRLVRRARIILRAAAGMSNAAIARELGTDRECVGRWRGRFADHGLAGIQHELLRPGRPPAIADTVLRAIAILATSTGPPGGTHWSIRPLARDLGVSPTTVHRIFRANGLRPDWVRPFGLRPSSRVLAHLTEVIGGYRTPLDSALVVCGDATWPLRVTHPRQPVQTRRRRPRRRAATHPTRYAELPLSIEERIPWSPEILRHRDWLTFLRRLAARVPRGRWVHVLADNAVTHQHPEVQRWVEDHPRIQLHLVPPHRRLPKWLAQRLQGWADEPFWGPSRQTIRTIREAVEALCPRRQRGKAVAAWMASRAIIKHVTGNPRWYLPPPGMRLENGRLVPC